MKIHLARHCGKKGGRPREASREQGPGWAWARGIVGGGRCSGLGR